MLWPSQMLVWCDFRCWGHPRWKKSLRGPWSAFAHANLCSKRLISHFGVSSHPKLWSKGNIAIFHVVTLTNARVMRFSMLRASTLKKIAQGAGRSLWQLICMLQKHMWDFWCVHILEIWPYKHFCAYRSFVTLKITRVGRVLILSASNLLKINYGARKSICPTKYMLQKHIWNFWCTHILKIWPKLTFLVVGLSWPSSWFVWSKFWLWGPPTCWGSFRELGKAFSPPNICPHCIFGTFGMPVFGLKLTFKPVGPPWLSKLLVWREF